MGGDLGGNATTMHATTPAIRDASSALTALGTVALVCVFGASCYAGKQCAFQLTAMGQYVFERTREGAEELNSMTTSTLEQSQRKLEKTIKDVEAFTAAAKSECPIGLNEIVAELD